MKQSDQHHPRIVIIDSNRLFRQKISYLLQNETRAAINKIDIFDSFDQFKASSGGEELDLLIIDERAFNGISKNGQYTLTSFNNPQFHMIIMSMHILHSTNKETIFDTNKVTQLSKSIDPLVFLELVENRLGINKNEQRTHCSISLTPREAEILEELVNGLSNKEIARKLAISDSTVKVHVQNILKKINVSSRVEAAVYAVRHQLIA